MIVGLFTGLEPVGGVQKVGRHVAAVLSDMARRTNQEYNFLSLNSLVGHGSERVGESGFEFQGFARNKASFVRAALRLAWKQPRLIFAGHANVGPVAAAMCRLAPHARILVFTHGIEVWSRLPAIRRWALRGADTVLAVSRYTAEQVEKVQGVDASRIRILPLALEPSFWECANHAGEVQPPAGFPAGATLLTVTRLAAGEGYKGVDTVIQALPQLAHAVPNVQYVVVGDGDDRPRLEALARTLGVAGRVHFLGRLAADSPELTACYASCDVFVMPSSGEGFGLVFLEAMAFGRPVVGGAHGGTPDVIEDGVTGFLVRHGDVEQLGQVLSTLLRDPGLRQQMGQRARARVEEKFLFPQFATRLRAFAEALYAGTLERECAS